jgi:hypothetical protein
MTFVQASTRAKVVRDHAGEAKIVKVDGGYMVFETLDEYDAWMAQR